MPGGFIPAHVGRGPNRIIGGGASGTPAASFNGVWCFDHFQAGDDSLQGWWPVILPYASTGGERRHDRERPFSGLDHGNQGNYVINAGSPKRTFGVVGYWHRDPGAGLPVSALPNTNPVSPLWLPLTGAASAWCGLRAHGDVAVTDPVTSNAFNQSVLAYNGSNRGVDGPTGGATVNQNFPGYGSQWDQMLYRDVVIASDGVSLTVAFQYRTALSTGALEDPLTRVGWFDKDPLQSAAPGDGNFISAADAQSKGPVDSFMVYVGVPVDTVTGVAQYIGSDGAPHALHDRQRRWFSEVLRINKPYVELLSRAGVNAASTFLVTLPNVTVQPILNSLPGTGGTVRIVFRVKTNRGFDDEDNGFSGFSSGTAGAAIVDEVNVNTGGPNLLTHPGFEALGSIDNNPATSAAAAWKTTGKPPAVFFHPHDLSSLVYDDPAGPPGSPGRTCNMFGKVVTPGNHDDGERPGGTFASNAQDRQDALASPTINMRSLGPGDFNAMGIDAAAASATSGYAVWFDLLENLYDLPNTGNGYRIGWQSYPAVQPNGVKCWSDVQKATYLSTGGPGCFAGFRGSSPGALANGLIVTSNVSGVPDSIRVFLEHVTRCYTLPLSPAMCSPSSGTLAGGHFDNVSLALIDFCANPGPRKNVSAHGLVDAVDPHPDVLATPSGVLLSAWGRLDGRVSFSRSRDGGFLFSRPRQIHGPAGHPALARTSIGSPGGTVLLATTAAGGIACSRSWNEGISFFPPDIIANSAGGANPAIAAGTNGHAHVVWDDGVNVHHSSSTDGGVNFSPVLLVAPDEGPTRPHRLPDVAVDDLHDVYAVWSHSHTASPPEDWIQLAMKTSAGSVFGAPVTISDPGRSARDARIVTRSGVVYALWIYAGTPDEVHLASAMSGSTTFQDLTDVQIPGSGGGSTRSLSAAVAADGTLHVVVETIVAGNRECFYFSRPAVGGAFSAPFNFTSSIGPSAAPAIALDGAGAPVIVWADDFGGAQDVFCTHP